MRDVGEVTPGGRRRQLRVRMVRAPPMPLRLLKAPGRFVLTEPLVRGLVSRALTRALKQLLAEPGQADKESPICF